MVFIQTNGYKLLFVDTRQYIILEDKSKPIKDVSKKLYTNGINNQIKIKLLISLVWALPNGCAE